MAIAVRVLKTATVTGEDGTLALTSDYVVPSGAALVLIGTGVYSDASSPAPYLSSVADTSTNTWGNVTNVNSAGYYTPQVFAALAHNVAAATPTVTATFTQSTSGNKFSVALLEITDAPTSSALDVAVSNTASSGTSITTSSTGPLSQAANALIGCFGGWIGIPNNPSGWSSALSVSNGGYLGCQISYRTIDDASSRTETFTSSEIAGGALLVLVIKQVSGAALRYKFELDDSTFTSADTAITGFVWRNTTPDSAAAQKFTGLAGSATAGTLYVTSNIPAAAKVGDTLYGIFYNSSDTSGLITGSVEVAS